MTEQHPVADAVILRPLEPRDIGQLYRFRNDEKIRSELGGFSLGYSMRDLEEWLEAHRKRRNEALFAVATRSEDVCIGHAGIYNIDHRVAKGEFAIMIGDAEWQGRGIGLHVTTKLLLYGFLELNLNKIELRVLANNERAIRLYKRARFTIDGVLRHEQFREGEYKDVIIMSILRDEWRQ